MVETTRERMIEATARLLQHRGHHGTSLNDILAEADAPRGSLYFHFPRGKDQLVIEATRLSVARTTDYLRAALANSGNPATAVREFIEETARLAKASDYTFGCPVAPLILDGSDGVKELEAVCRQAFEDWTGLLREAFVAAGMPPARADTLALMVEATHEGLFLIARAYRDTAPLLNVARELEEVIHSALSETANR